MTHLQWTTPLGPWLAVITAVLSGIAAVRIVHHIWQVIQLCFKSSISIEIESSGTDKPVLEITRLGAPLKFSAEGRIVRTLDSKSIIKPRLSRFACELHPPGGRPAGQHLTLGDSEWAHIVLADVVGIDTNLLPGAPTRMRVRTGSYHRGVPVEDSGIELEIIVKTHPEWPLRPLRISRRILLTRPRVTDISAIDASDVNDV